MFNIFKLFIKFLHILLISNINDNHFILLNKYDKIINFSNDNQNNNNFFHYLQHYHINNTTNIKTLKYSNHDHNIQNILNNFPMSLIYLINIIPTFFGPSETMH